MKHVLDLRTRAERECAHEMRRRAHIEPTADFWDRAFFVLIGTILVGGSLGLVISLVLLAN